MPKNIQLTVLKGGRDKQIILKSIILKIVPDTLSPLPVDVRIFEEDTFLVLTVDQIMRYREEHPIRLMTKVAEAKPNKPGSIVTNESSWYAIVHDLDNEPSCRLEWINKAYHQALMLGEINRVRRLGLPLLGSVHGKIAAETSLELLVGAIKSNSFEHLKKILIPVSLHERDKAWHLLQKLTK